MISRAPLSPYPCLSCTVDCARVLLRSVEELAATDIASHAVEQLRCVGSRVGSGGGDGSSPTSQPPRPFQLPTSLHTHTNTCCRCSAVREVHLVGRRGPVQAAFTPKELRELLSLPGVQVGAPEAAVAESRLCCLPSPAHAVPCTYLSRSPRCLP